MLLIPKTQKLKYNALIKYTLWVRENDMGRSEVHFESVTCFQCKNFNPQNGLIAADFILAKECQFTSKRKKLQEYSDLNESGYTVAHLQANINNINILFELYASSYAYGFVFVSNINVNNKTNAFECM